MLWLLTILSLIGVWLNIQKNPWCFVLWIGTNGAWAIEGFMKDMPALGVMFTVYLLFSVYGLVKWWRE